MIVLDLVDIVWHPLVKTDFSLDVQNEVHSHQKHNWPPGGRVSVRTCTVIRRLHNAQLRARRPVKRPYLSPHYRQARLQWANDHLRWNIRNWQKIHWSDESIPFTASRWTYARLETKNTAYNENNIFPTSAFGSSGKCVGLLFSQMQAGPLCSQWHYERTNVSRFRTERYRCSAFWQPSTGKSSALHGWQRQTT